MKKIIANPKILAGKPVIEGTRIFVEFVLEMFSSGMSMEDILIEYPHLKREDILSAINYSIEVLKNKKLYSYK